MTRPATSGCRTNGGLAQTFNCDGLNQLTNVSRNRRMTVSGATPAPAASVTVNGQPAQTYGDFTFARTNLTLSDGTNTFTIVAQSLTGSNATSTLTLNLPQSVALSWDSNGNLTNDGTRSLCLQPGEPVDQHHRGRRLEDGLCLRRPGPAAD